MKDVNTLSEYLADEERVSQEDLEAVNLEAALISRMIAAREEQGLSQRELAELSGIKQPAIARMESLRSTPQIDTMLKVLVPLGYTLQIVPLQKRLS